jgi:hypothetical protein
MSSEFTSGMIWATLAAIPDRRLLMTAKAAVFGVLALVTGRRPRSFSSSRAERCCGTASQLPLWVSRGVLRAVVLTGTSFCLIGLLGLGLGTIIRHSAAAIGVLVGGVYVLAQFIGTIAHAVSPYMPILIVGNSLRTTKPESCGGNGAQCVQFLSAWAGSACCTCMPPWP